jgi:hypothetical protein
MPRMDTIEKIWRLWPTVAAMAAETDYPAARLYRSRAAGEMPPPSLDVPVMARAAVGGVSLTYGEIALARWRWSGSPGGDLVRRALL